MAVRIDPAKNEIGALLDMADFSGQEVLEIGCGDGRLTWRYAERAKHVTAIDPVERNIARARESCPEELKSIVEFQHSAFEEFAAASESSTFDMAILSWSLC